MELLDQHARQVSPSLYEHDPNYFSLFKPKIHKDAQLSDDASVQCQVDLLGKERLGEVCGNLNLDGGGFISLTMPYCFPERLSLISYANEAAFIYDDIGTDNIDVTLLGSSDSNPEIDGSGHNKTTGENRSKQVLSKIIAGLTKIDAIWGQEVIRQLKAWKYDDISMKENFHNYTNLRSYLVDRMEDVAWRFVIALARYGANIIVTEEEDAALAPIVQPLYDATILVNDYFSFDKEYTTGDGKDAIVVPEVPTSANAVVLFIKWDKLSIEEAKMKVKDEILRLEAHYCGLRDTFLSNNTAMSLRPTVLQWMKLTEAIAAGNAFWSLKSARYNLEIENPYQQYYKRRVKGGVHFFENCLESTGFLPQAPSRTLPFL